MVPAAWPAAVVGLLTLQARFDALERASWKRADEARTGQAALSVHGVRLPVGELPAAAEVSASPRILVRADGLEIDYVAWLRSLEPDTARAVRHGWQGATSLGDPIPAPLAGDGLARGLVSRFELERAHGVLAAPLYDDAARHRLDVALLLADRDLPADAVRGVMDAAFTAGFTRIEVGVGHPGDDGISTFAADPAPDCARREPGGLGTVQATRWCHLVVVDVGATDATVRLSHPGACAVDEVECEASQVLAAGGCAVAADPADLAHALRRVDGLGMWRCDPALIRAPAGTPWSRVVEVVAAVQGVTWPGGFSFETLD